ncbi:MAG: helix-turn-helix domain-containing protein [Lachnospiraceae bacterium]|nr:helix-turn-helix domain-containing protein [Lachnospiraceae bacterium]
MARVSTKENKSIYQRVREEKGLSREKASELLEYITPERLERIENSKFDAKPDEIMTMAEKYQMPQLCNYYCANECAIGKHYVPEIQMKDLSQIVLEMLASLHSIQKSQDRLIEITADGNIENEEMDDFVNIQEELEKISLSVETMQLWVEKKIASGNIDFAMYQEAVEKRKSIKKS